MPEAAAILRQASSDPAVGAMVSRGVDEEPVRYLLNQLDAAQDPRRRVLVLEAIGNSGSAAFLDRIVPLAEQDSDEEVRAAATLARAAVEDPSEEVRAVAARTIAERALRE